MIRYEFNRTSWPDYDTGDQREWVITNGLGSYGGASLIGGLLGFFFLPAIVAGGGLLVLKTLKSWNGQQLKTRMNVLVILHFALFIMNIALIADML